MSKFVGLMVLALAVALVAVPVYAEVQNVKVSGDIDVKAITHHNFDLKAKQLNAPPGNAAVTNDDEGDLVLQTTRVRVDADLTDNVSATVRLLNQRFWDGQSEVDASNNIDLDYGYVTLKELVYSPLTVTVGRQPLQFGTGFIVGAGLLADPNGMFAGASVTPGNGTIAQEFSEYNSYDAIKATLDFSPLVVDAIWSKINETGVTTNDQTLYGINLNWKGVPVDRWNGEVELYWFWKNDQSFATAVHDNARTMNENDVHTIGTRAAVDPIENLHLNGEFAYQIGSLEDDATVASAGAEGFLSRDRRAWALNVSANYTWANVNWTPNTGVGYVHYSGEETGSNSTVSDKDNFNGWDPMFRGQFFTAISEFLAGNDATNLYATVDPNDTAANTNRDILYFDASVKPMQDLSLWLRYSHQWFDEAPVAGRSKNAGDEIDAKATYDYTEDVQFGLIGAWFFPGKYYDQAAPNSRGNETAWEVVGDMSVKF